MAGIIDIRYDRSKREWTAKPRFAFDMESFLHGAPTGIGQTLEIAFYRLVDKLPKDMANELLVAYPRRVYNSPERDMGSIDKCIEVDGHCPSQWEFNQRRFAYNREKSIQEGLAKAKAAAQA